MSVRRRSFLRLGPALGAAGALAVPSVGTARAHVPTPRQAPAEPFAVGQREFGWSRGERQLVTRVWYPAAGTAGGDPVPEAPVADGVFPVVAWNHGAQFLPEDYLGEILPLAAAGFVVAAPVLPASADDLNSGERSRDVSEVLTRILALDDAADEDFAGHLDTAAGVGVAGHSLGAMTTHGLLTAWPDDRVTAAVLCAMGDMGNPAPQVAANVLFLHADTDPVADYAAAREAYAELPAPKAFLTHLGQDHYSYLWQDAATYPQTRDTLVDWLRWSLYGDVAARDRLPADAASDGTAWESALG